MVGKRLVVADAGHDVDQVEHLQRADDGDHQQEEGGRRQQRQGDVAELAEAARAVDLRRLVVLARNALQAGQKDHHVVADAAPEEDDHDGDDRGLRVVQPLRLRQPESPSVALIGPKPGSNSHFQIVAVATGIVSTGMKKRVR